MNVNQLTKIQVTSHLSKESFSDLIANAPLVAIDLLVRKKRGDLLLGLRSNPPARGTWFTPGGRIRKLESIADAFSRIALDELNQSLPFNDARLVGAFTHIYQDNIYASTDARMAKIETHYVVLAYELQVPDDFQIPQSTSQHTEFIWFNTSLEGEKRPRVFGYDIHENVLPYLGIARPVSESQYQVLNSRRDTFNNLLWQSPVVSLTAQAFLFAIILAKDTAAEGRFVACVLSIVVSLSSLHLMAKHRFMEQEHAKLLHMYEVDRGLYPANGKIQAPHFSLKASSYKLWRAVLWAFFVAAFLAPMLMKSGAV